MAKQFEIDMSRGRLAPKIIRFCIPVILSGMLQLAFTAADLIVVGRFSGSNALAAVGSTNSLIQLLINLLMGFGTGASVLVSRHYGAKDEKALQDTIRATVAIAVIGGIIFAVISQFLSLPLLRKMDTPEEVLPLSALYLRIYFAGLPVIALYNFSSAILRAVGDSKRPLYYLTLAGVLNVFMNLFFVLALGMSVDGVAYATVISQCVSCALTVRCLIRSDSICKLVLSPYHLSAREMKRILRIGLPAGVQGSLFSISNVLIQSSVNYFGAMVMAGNSAANNVEGFLLVAQDGVNQGAVASISQNMGARKYERTRDALKICLLLNLALSLIGISIIHGFARPLLSLYTEYEEAIAPGVIRFMFVAGFYFLNGYQNMMAGVMRAHGYSILPTLVALSGICGIRLIWIFTVFEHTHSLKLLFLSYPISWAVTIIVQFTCYFLLRKKAYARNELLYQE